MPQPGTSKYKASCRPAPRGLPCRRLTAQLAPMMLLPSSGSNATLYLQTNQSRRPQCRVERINTGPAQALHPHWYMRQQWHASSALRGRHARPHPLPPSSWSLGASSLLASSTAPQARSASNTQLQGKGGRGGIDTASAAQAGEGIARAAARGRPPLGQSSNRMLPPTGRRPRLPPAACRPARCWSPSRWWTPCAASPAAGGGFSQGEQWC